MKKFTLLYVILLLLASCQKEDAETINQPEEKRLSISSYDVGFDQRGWLVFEDYQHMRNVVEHLDQEDDQYFLEFENSLSQITEETSYEDELQIIDQCGIVDQAVYKGFENNFSGYTSLRHIYSQAEENWLDQQTGDSIDFGTCPEHYISAPGLSTIFNEYGEVQVGDIVYMTKEDGRQIGIFISELENVEVTELRALFHSESFDLANYDQVAITDEDTINQFLYGGEKIYSNGAKPGGITVYASIAIGAVVVKAMADGVKWLNSGNNHGDCYFDRNTSETWINDNGDRKIKADLKYQQILVYGQNAFIKLRSYKKSDYLGWVKKSAQLKVEVIVPHILPNNNGFLVCFDGYDDIKSDDDEKNNWYKVSESKRIAPYHGALIHPGYMRGKYYKNGIERLDFYIL